MREKAGHSGVFCAFVWAAALLLLIPAGPAHATELPPGFAETDVLGTLELFGIRSFDWSDDGIFWIVQGDGLQGERIWAYRGSTGVLAFDANQTPVGEQGIETLVVDPDYATNGYIWVYYTIQGSPAHNQLSRFEVAPDDTLINETVMLIGPDLTSELHNGGCLEITDDGHIYLGMGDDFLWSTTAQDTFDLRGKILKLHRDGTPSHDNPFLDGTGGNPYVWAYGFRNPFRCVLQPDSEALFIGDVGSFRFEEINVGVNGGNFGWSTTEGPNPPGLPGLTYPAYAYPSRLGDGTGAAVILGDFAGSGDFDGSYEGDFFWADRIRKEIYRSTLDENQGFASIELFAELDAAQLTDLRFGPDGALYYSSGGAIQNIRRVEWVGGSNRQPTAVAQVSPDAGPAPLVVALDGTDSSDPDDDPLTYEWDLGDGNGTTGATAGYTYPQGVYDVLLSVDDGNGLDDDSPTVRVVSGNSRPQVSVSSPANGSKYNAGQSVFLDGSGVDTEETTIPCSQYGWQGIFHHNDHTHPFFGPEQGECSKTITIPDRGEEETNVWYRFVLTVSDTGQPIGAEGTLTGTHEVQIFPNLSEITLETQPFPDLELLLDTNPVTAPFTLDSVVGIIRSIGAVNDQLRSNGHRYSWIGWSDGGDEEHEVATPPVPATFTAAFGCDVIVEAANLIVGPAPQPGEIRLDWDPVSDICLTATQDRYRIYAAATPRPATLPGDFPLDPAFELVGTTNGTTFTYPPLLTHQYYVVVAVGTDLRDGLLGHYGE